MEIKRSLIFISQEIAFSYVSKHFSKNTWIISMSAYVINPGVYGEYVQKTMPILMKYEGKPIVVDNENETAEGEDRNQVVVLEFLSKEKAWGWINDEEYAEVKKLRHKATKDGFMTVADEFVFPS